MTQETGLETHMQGQCEARPDVGGALSLTEMVGMSPGCRELGGGERLAWEGGAGSCPSPRPGSKWRHSGRAL